MIENLLSSFTELENKLKPHQFDALKNATMMQWSVIIKLIKECEADENKIQMYAKQIDVLRKMMQTYEEIVKKQNAEINKLEAGLVVNSKAESIE